MYREEVGVVHGRHHVLLDQVLHILQAHNAVPADSLAVLHNIIEDPVDHLWVKLLQLWEQLPISRAILCTHTFLDISLMGLLQGQKYGQNPSVGMSTNSHFSMLQLLSSKVSSCESSLLQLLV